MKKTNPSFNSFSPFSLSNPFFAQTITIAIVIAILCNDRQQRMQPALSPPPSSLPRQLSLSLCRHISKHAAAMAKLRFCQAAASTAKLAAATVLPPPPPLPTRGNRCAATAYKINKKGILLTNLFFTTMVMTACSDDCGTMRQQ